jgi:hypothetical protein
LDVKDSIISVTLSSTVWIKFVHLKILKSHFSSGTHTPTADSTQARAKQQAGDTSEHQPPAVRDRMLRHLFAASALEYVGWPSTTFWEGSASFTQTGRRVVA